MPKFSALSFRDLQSAERRAGRVARKAHFVVEVEADDGSWCELDADDRDHAKRLADNWVGVCRARGCSCWMVNSVTGRLAGKCFYKIFEEA